MGKHKTQRTEALHQAARRYVLAKQAQQAIAQHNLDKLVRSGVIMTEPTTSHAAYTALNLGIKGKSMLNLKEGGGLRKGLTPQVGGIGFNHSVPRSVNGF